MDMEIRKPIKRIEIYFSRIDGEYPRFKYFVGEIEVPFIRGRLRLEGDLVNATEITVVAEEGASFVPTQARIPIVRGKVFVQLAPAQPQDNMPDTLIADINIPDVDEYTLTDDGETSSPDDLEEFEGKKRASATTIRILIAACLVCAGILIWFFLSDRFISSDPHVTDSDSIKTDTLAKDTAQDTEKTDTTLLKPAAAPAPAIRHSVRKSSTPADDSYNDTMAEEEPIKKRTLPEGTNLVEGEEH